MRNPLQEQLLKAGLAKKSKLDQVNREQARQRNAKGASTVEQDRIDADRLRLEQQERDRALAAERNAQARAAELRVQARQLIEQNRLPAEGEIDYRFTDGGKIHSVRVTDAARRQLAKGSLVVVRHEQGYAVVPRATAEKVEARDPSLIAVDHSRTGANGRISARAVSGTPLSPSRAS